MTRLPRLLITTAAIAALLAACGGVDGATEPLDAPDEPAGEDAVDDEDRQSREPREDAVPEDGTQPEVNGQADADPTGAFSDWIAIAAADAAASFDVAPGDIEVVSAEEVTWPDGAVGCPQPDMMYTQALVDGYRIVLSVDGDEVAYHAANDNPPQRCDDPRDPIG